MKIFAPDELVLTKVPPQWDRDALLAQSSIFFLKDLLQPLALERVVVRHHIHAIIDTGQCAYQVMGLRKIWQHWIVRMQTFAPYYRQHLISWVRAVDPSWNREKLRKQKGVFPLTAVAAKLGYTKQYICHRARNAKNSKKTIGVWKDPITKRYLVDMKRFSAWLQNFENL